MIKSVCFLSTYKCNAVCDFCECGPEITEHLTAEDMIRYIDEACALGTVSLVVFSGGEPTLYREDLLRSISYANSKGLATRVVTNGWWGKTKESASKFLEKLIDCGLTEMNISVDDLHQEWIPLESIKNALRLCVERDFQCLIAHKAMVGAKITKESLEDYCGVELLNYDEEKDYTPNEGARLFSTGCVVPVGRTPAGFSDDVLKFGKTNYTCSSILKDIIIGPDHKMLACCGIVTKNLPELSLGDLRESSMLTFIEKANCDLMLNWLALEGPSSIANFILREDSTVPFKENYVNGCHLCNDVLTITESRKVLSENVNKAVNRITLHRDYLEAIRSDKKLVDPYC